MHYRRLIFALSLGFIGLIGKPVLKAQDVKEECKAATPAVKAETTQDVNAKDRWLAQLRYRDTSGGTACCFDEKSGLRCDDFSSLRYCEEGSDPRIEVDRYRAPDALPAFTGDEVLDTSLYVASAVGALFVKCEAGRSMRDH